MHNMELILLLASVAVTAVTGQDLHIIDGTNVTEQGKWPFMGSLWTYETYFECGISLISEDWGLTAAYCVSYSPQQWLRFRFGSNSRSSGGKVYTAKEVIVHEDYTIEGFYARNDIAVVRFNEPVAGEYIASIPLAVNGSDHAGTDDCWIMGWGYTDIFESKLPEHLQEANVTILSVEECSRRQGGERDETVVCAEGTGRTTCDHDQGGPVVCKVNGRHELVGAAAYNFHHCDPDYVPLSTRISYFRDWIYDKTGI